MRCVECSAEVGSLYTEYAKDNFRLTQCPNCLKFADKYIEFDYVVLTIDVMLLKPQVYRHLLFNALARQDKRMQRSVARLGLLLILFDVYLKWYRVEKRSQTMTRRELDQDWIIDEPSKSYMYFLALSILETLAFHIGAQQISQRFFGAKSSLKHMISTALLISSCAKLVPVFMVIWEYDIPEAAVLVDWAVVIYNIEALRILLECGYFAAVAIIMISVAARTLTAWTFINSTALSKQPGMEDSVLSGFSVIRTLLSS